MPKSVFLKSAVTPEVSILHTGILRRAKSFSTHVPQ